MTIVTVPLSGNRYQIHIADGLLDRAGPLLRKLPCQVGKAVVITDTTVGKHYGERLQQSLALAGYQPLLIEVTPGEAQKSLTTAGQIYEKLSEFKIERATPILALGGGMVGDLAGFVAATYQRGQPLIQVPTTLLAQVDSSIGGKCAINHGHIKNKIGLFYQPRLVICDPQLLQTLPKREIGSGLGEVIKYGMILDQRLFRYLECQMPDILAGDASKRELVIARCASIKARLVAKDEHDHGLRQLLNFGHTVGHAIESVSAFGLTHGEAVALGMMIASRMAMRLGRLPEEQLRRLGELIVRAGLPTALPETFSIPLILDFMAHDKKITAAKIKFILPCRIGKGFITDAVSPTLVEETLRQSL